MRLDGGICDRVAYQIYTPTKLMRTELQNKLNSLKIRTGTPIYEIVAEALALYELKINQDMKERAEKQRKLRGTV